jgi:arylsulfatase
MVGKPRAKWPIPLAILALIGGGVALYSWSGNDSDRGRRGPGGGTQQANDNPAIPLIRAQPYVGPRPKNVMIVTIDTLRADYVSAYGYDAYGPDFKTTPNLDRWMQRGVRFDSAISTASFTVPAHASIFTGLYPSYTSSKLSNGDRFGLADSFTTLAEVCRDAGMYTLGIVSSHTLIDKVGFAQGFDKFDDDIREANPLHPVGKQRADHARMKVQRWLPERGDKPFFMWLHLMDPHGPYVPPFEWLQRVPQQSNKPFNRDLPAANDGSQFGYDRIPSYQRFKYYQSDPVITQADDYVRRYVAEIAFMDHELGRLLDELEERGVMKDTLVIVTADHGEAFGEDNYWFAHSQSAGLELIRVPLAMWGPGIKPAWSSETVGAIDIFATVCDMLGLDGSTGRHSISLASHLATGDKTLTQNRPYFTSASTGNQRGVALTDLYYRGPGKTDPAPRFQPELRALPFGPLMPLEQAAALRDSMTQFEWHADEALKSPDDESARVRRTAAEKQHLRHLGYLSDNDDGGPRSGARVFYDPDYKPDADPTAGSDSLNTTNPSPSPKSDRKDAQP